MPLFETVPINSLDVGRIVKENWELELGECLKASQNHTFVATRNSSRFAVRVTPDPTNKVSLNL